MRYRWHIVHARKLHNISQLATNFQLKILRQLPVRLAMPDYAFYYATCCLLNWTLCCSHWRYFHQTIILLHLFKRRSSAITWLWSHYAIMRLRFMFRLVFSSVVRLYYPWCSICVRSLKLKIIVQAKGMAMKWN